MSTPKPAPKGPKVSPVRTIVSLVLLAVVGVLCVIELRAGLGNYLTGQAFKKNSNEGGFTDMTMEKLDGLVSFGPKKEIAEDGGELVTYRYQWYSLLRGLIGERPPEIYVVASVGDSPKALSYYALEKGEEPPSTKQAPATSSGQAPSAPGAGMGPPGGGMGGMRPPADNPMPTPTMRPPADDSDPADGAKDAPADGAAPAGSAPAAPADAPAAAPAPAEGNAAPAAPSDAPAGEAPKN